MRRGGQTVYGSSPLQQRNGNMKAIDRLNALRRSFAAVPQPNKPPSQTTATNVKMTAAIAGPAGIVPNIPSAPTPYDLAEAINKAVTAIHELGTRLQQVDAHIQQLS